MRHKNRTSRCLLWQNIDMQPAPTSVWGYKGCAGKGGKTLNAAIIHTNDTKKETTNENEHHE